MTFRENFKQYWFAHIFGHAGIALLSLALAITVHPICGIVFIGQLVRQCGGYWQKQDTLSIDLSWVIGGAVAGMLIGSVIVKWSLF